MSTPELQGKRSRKDLCTQILRDSRQLMLSSQFSLTCQEQASLKQLEFVAQVLSEEVELRAENKRNRLLKRAGFPSLKTLEGYELGQVEFPSGFTMDDIRDLSFVNDHRNLLMYGPVGTGKTHLAVAAGVEACRRGMSVRFFTVAQLIRRLTEASKKEKLDRFINDLKKSDLVILDEWGYIPLDRTGAQLLFQVVSDCYEHTSVILTTNLEFSRWGAILTDEQMAAAMIDRLVHHGHMLVFTGQSYRMRHSLMRTQTDS